MDTVTHAIAGALIGKGIFASRAEPSASATAPRDEYSTPARVAVVAATIGAAFPDVDVVYDIFSRDDLAVLKYHRYITHSWVCLPLWALLLAWLTQWITRRWKIAAPSFGWLWLCYAVGIASHILLDLSTSFGTMEWSPISLARPAWDLIFIIDLTMTALLLLPQLAYWVGSDPGKRLRRASRMWALLTLIAVAFAWLAAAWGAGFSPLVVVGASMLIAALFFVPALTGWGTQWPRSSWSRAGLAAGTLYLLACALAHHLALGHVRAFASAQSISPQALAALPAAPSLWRWEGLIRTADGVYLIRDDLLRPQSREIHFFADSAPPEDLARMRDLPQVREYLEFARFPVFRAVRAHGQSGVEISDLRFFSARGGTIPGFTFRVLFNSAGQVAQQGMLRSSRAAAARSE
jgi:membrane-bound metal-dependent hydrolase YbcI (DUF457 family)